MGTTSTAIPDAPSTQSRPGGGPLGSLAYPKIPLYRFLEDAARRSPRNTALIFFGQRTSYADLFDEAKRVAAGLTSLGMARGDRVAMMLPNCPQAVAAYYGTLWAGGIAVMLNPLYTARELKLQLQDSGARFLIVLDLLATKALEGVDRTPVEHVIVTGIRERLPWLLGMLYPLKLKLRGSSTRVPRHGKVIPYSQLLSAGALESPVSVDPRADVALLQYTGGTTGLPRAAMLTHFNLVANCIQLDAWLPALPEDLTVAGVLPFFHVYGMTTVMNFGVMKGARIILLPRFSIRDVLISIEKYRPQIFPGVPAMYAALNNYPEVGKFDLSSIRWCVSGAAPLAAQVKQTFEKLTGGRLVEGYGLTEASPVTHSNPLDGVQKTGSIGLPLPDTEYRIVDLKTGEPVATGEAGELIVRGPQVMQGYWNRPEETARTLRDGWLHTGDVARVDPEGYVYIVDRIKEMIIVSGYNVYPREVEEVLYQHPAVREAAVIGVPDAIKGEAVKAFVVLKDAVQCSADEIAEWSKRQLAPYKVPKQVEFVTELPKSLIGKVLRRVLVERDRATMAPGG
ncbi:MAG: long-chain fatty acid--CoA ligase [Chloroflexi bacterium]|nr:long-chain fatty acid--CoA ligase [Chloroflexota bacterium]